MIVKAGSNGNRTPSGKRKVGQGDELEDQDAVNLAADWADISQGLRKDLGHQLFTQWNKPI
ncbi:MAG: chromosomal replication initiator protein DnaA, partial [Novosphingobium sp.]